MAEVVTPKKPIQSSFSSCQKCVVCGSFLDDPRKRVKLKKELVSNLQEIVASETLDPEGIFATIIVTNQPTNISS